MLLDLIRIFLFPGLMAFAAASDVLTMTISNRVSILLIVGFFMLALVSGMGLAAVGLHVAAGFTVFVLGFACFAFGWIGGGDAKVAAAAALWFGFDPLLNYLIYSSLVGGALTLIIIQLRSVPLPALLQGQSWLERLHNKNSGIPYGVALAIGALLIYPDTDWVKAVDVAHLAMR